MYLIFLKYWTLDLMSIMVYPKVLFHPNFSIKALTGLRGEEQGLCPQRLEVRADLLAQELPDRLHY